MIKFIFSILFLSTCVFADTPSQVLYFANSLVNTNGTVSLDGDSATPGNLKYFGTNGSGTRGYYSLPSSAIWGSITGTLSNQTDLQSALNAKEPTISAGTSLQYWRGDKTFQTLNTLAVPELTNLYFTNARARLAISGTSPISYDNSTGVISFTGSSGANTSLSNLTTTAINQDLEPSVDEGHSIGSASKNWSVGNFHLIGFGGNNVINLAGQTLRNSSAQTMLGWGGANLDFQNNTIQNVADPILAQDGATKNYVDTHSSNITIGTANGLSLAGSVLSLGTSSASTTGALPSADWTTFNNKQNALTPGSISTSTTGVTIGNGSSATVGPNVTVNIQNASTSQNGLMTSTDWNTFNAKQVAGNYITALTGDVTASGPGSVAATIAANAVSNTKLAQMAANTIKGNNTGSTANAADLTVAQTNTLLGLYQQAAITTTQIVWVTKAGNDTTGTGTYDNPYLTVTKALSVITDNSLSKRYSIKIGTGTYAETAIVLKPWVSLIGVDRSNVLLQVTGAGANVTLDSTFGSGNARTMIQNLTFSSSTNLNLDIQTAGGTFSRVLELDYVSIGGNFTFKATNAGDYLDMTDTTVIGTSTLQCGNIFIGYSTLNSNVTINTTGASTDVTPTLVSNAMYGNLTLGIDGSKTNYLFMVGSLPLSITANSSQITIDADVSSFPPSANNSITGGTVIIRESDASYLGYTPTTSGNWGASVPVSALTGLDDLAAGTATPPQWLIGSGAAASSNAKLIIKDGHIKSTMTTAPTVTVQSSAGTGATCSVSSASDTKGQISVTTGTVGLSTGSYCKLNFNKSYGTAPICVLTPAGSSLSSSVYVTSATGSMDVNFALAGGVTTTYVINYHCLE